jgi:hypothetical protein
MNVPPFSFFFSSFLTRRPPNGWPFIIEYKEKKKREDLDGQQTKKLVHCMCIYIQGLSIYVFLSLSLFHDLRDKKKKEEEESNHSTILFVNHSNGK